MSAAILTGWQFVISLGIICFTMICAAAILVGGDKK